MPRIMATCKSEGCTNQFWTNDRGFVRKYCDDHKPKRWEPKTALKEALREVRASEDRVENAPPPLVPDPAALSQSQLQELLTALAAQNREAIELLARELRKPDEETVAEKEAERQRMEKQRQNRLTAARKAIAARESLYAYCASRGHADEKGRAVVGGQVNTGDGLWHGFCLRCGYEFPPVSPRGDMMTGTTALTNFSFGDGNMTIQ